MKYGIVSNVRRILSRRQVSTGFNAYFRAVQRHGGEGIPTFSEAQRDFRGMGGRYNEYHS